MNVTTNVQQINKQIPLCYIDKTKISVFTLKQHTYLYIPEKADIEGEIILDLKTLEPVLLLSDSQITVLNNPDITIDIKHQ